MMNKMNTTFFASGLDVKAFYAKHEIDISKYCNSDIEGHLDVAASGIKFNLDLLAEHYSKDLSLQYEDAADKMSQVSNMLGEDLSSNLTFYEPMIFDEKIAVECFLIPFTYKGNALLSLPCHSSIDLTPRLEAYQLLTHYSIDRQSKLFNMPDAERYFASALLGNETIVKLLKVIELLPKAAK